MCVCMYVYSSMRGALLYLIYYTMQIQTNNACVYACMFISTRTFARTSQEGTSRPSSLSTSNARCVIIFNLLNYADTDEPCMCACMHS